MRHTHRTMLMAFGLSYISFTAFSQTCNDLEIQDGAKSTLLITQFINPLNGDKKFMKAKDEQRDEMIALYNADILSGKTVPTVNSSMEFTIKKNELIDAVEYAVGYNVGGVDYFSYLVCKNDTVYSCRNRGPVLVGTPDNPIGISLQGILTYPLNLKVGDVLPSCEDISFTIPETTDIVVKKKVFSHYERQGSTREFGHYTDSQTGQSGFGAYDKTPPAKAIFKTIDVDVQKTFSMTGHSLQGVNQRVTAEQEVTVSGKKYKAYIIESESWSKPKINVSYESVDEEVTRELMEQDAKYTAKNEKLMIRKSFTNKLGYMVQYSTGWFVPQLGSAVKIISYDIYGGISTIMATAGLE